jgi:hypothetical protein
MWLSLEVEGQAELGELILEFRKVGGNNGRKEKMNSHQVLARWTPCVSLGLADGTLWETA